MDFSVLTSYAAVIVYAIAIMVFEALFFIKVGPHFTKRAILKGLSSEEGKVILREFLMGMIAQLQEEIEVDGPVGDDGKPAKVKTTLGNVIMAQVASAVVQHLKMTFLGEKGNISRELGALQGEATLAAVPAQFQPYMAMLMPYMKKYPIVGMLASVIMGMQGQKGQAGGLSFPTSPQGKYGGL